MNLDPKHLRKVILKMAYQANSGHIGCALSIVDILSDLFQNKIKKEDHFILSKGHGVMALYAVYSETGRIPKEWLDTYLKDGTPLHGLSEYKYTDVSSGSLGHGLPIAVGIALALKLEKKPGQVYCLIGDGEMNEGSIYEAFLFASHHQLSNLHIIVDHNHFQAMGRVEEIQGMKLDFNLVTLVETVKGKGVSFMEGDNSYHYKRMTQEEFERAMAEQDA